MRTTQSLQITAEHHDTCSSDVDHQSPAVNFRVRKRSPQKKIHAGVFLMNYSSCLMAEKLQALTHFNKLSSSPCLLEQKEIKKSKHCHA